MGPRDALGSPAFLLYVFFILLSILRLEMRFCLFTGMLPRRAFYFLLRSNRHIGTRGGGGAVAHTRLSFLPIAYAVVAGLVAGLLAKQILRQVEGSLHTVLERDRAVRIFGQYVSPQIAENLLKTTGRTRRRIAQRLRNVLGYS